MKCGECGGKWVKVYTRPRSGNERLCQWRCKGCGAKMVTVERVIAIQRASVKGSAPPRNA